MKKNTASQSNRTLFTRKCIGEAVISLLQDTDIVHLRISAVAQKAGVSRITFYNYYTSVQEVLEDYLKIIVSEYIEEGVGSDGETAFRTYDHILFSLNFFDRYRTFFLTMKKQGLYSVLIDSVNDFVINIKSSSQTNQDTLSNAFRYRQYSYAGSLLNCFIMWEESGKADSAEDVANMIHKLYGDID